MRAKCAAIIWLDGRRTRLVLPDAVVAINPRPGNSSPLRDYTGVSCVGRRSPAADPTERRAASFTRLTILQARRCQPLHGSRYGPEGGFLPLVATKLTQSPWFLNTPKVFQPPFLHSSTDVGSVAILATKASRIAGVGRLDGPAVVGKLVEAV